MANKAKTFILDQTGAYFLADEDADTSTQYYGYVRPDGTWYIQRITTNSGDNLYRYYLATTDYATGWTNRASHTYDYPHEVFD